MSSISGNKRPRVAAEGVLENASSDGSTVPRISAAVGAVTGGGAGATFNGSIPPTASKAIDLDLPIHARADRTVQELGPLGSLPATITPHFVGLDLGTQFSGCAEGKSVGAIHSVKALRSYSDTHVNLHNLERQSGSAGSDIAKGATILAIQTYEAAWEVLNGAADVNRHLLSNRAFVSSTRKVLYGDKAEDVLRAEYSCIVADAKFTPEYDVYVGFKQALYQTSAQRRINFNPYEATSESLTRKGFFVRCVDLMSLSYGRLLTQALDTEGDVTEEALNNVHAIATHPSGWDSAAVEALGDALLRAPIWVNASKGIPKMARILRATLIPESLAALCSMLISVEIEPNTNVMVVDVGAGTLDTTCACVMDVGADVGAPFLRLKELLWSRGSDLGATYVEDTFLTFFWHNFVKPLGFSVEEWNHAAVVHHILKRAFRAAKDSFKYQDAITQAEFEALPDEQRLRWTASRTDKVDLDLRALFDLRRSADQRDSLVAKLREIVNQLSTKINDPLQITVVGGTPVTYVQGDARGTFAFHANIDKLVLPTKLLKTLVDHHISRVEAEIKAGLKAIHALDKQIDQVLLTGFGAHGFAYQKAFKNTFPTLELRPSQSDRLYAHPQGYSVQCSRGAVLYGALGRDCIQQTVLSKSFGVGINISGKGDIPDSAGKPWSLPELFNASTADLKTAGVQFSVRGAPHYGYVAPFARQGDVIQEAGAVYGLVNENMFPFLVKAGTVSTFDLYAIDERINPITESPHMIVNNTRLPAKSYLKKLPAGLRQRLVTHAQAFATISINSPRTMHAVLKFAFIGEQVDKVFLEEANLGAAGDITKGEQVVAQVVYKVPPAVSDMEPAQMASDAMLLLQLASEDTEPDM